MTNNDLSKLRLDKSGANFRRKQKLPRWGLIAIGAIAAISIVFLLFVEPCHRGGDRRGFPGISLPVLHAPFRQRIRRGTAQSGSCLQGDGQARMARRGGREQGQDRRGHRPPREPGRPCGQRPGRCGREQCESGTGRRAAELRPHEGTGRERVSWPSPNWTPPILVRNGPRPP